MAKRRRPRPEGTRVLGLGRRPRPEGTRVLGLGRRGEVPGIAWEIAFEAEIRQLPAGEKLTYLRRMHAARLRALGRGPGRMFRVVNSTGSWDLLV